MSQEPGVQHEVDQHEHGAHAEPGLLHRAPTDIIFTPRHFLQNNIC